MKNVLSGVIIAFVVMAGITQVGAETDQAHDRIMGAGLHITTCQRRPNSGIEWRRYALCQNRNMASIRAWSEQLDRCIGAIAVQSRADDAYYVDGRHTTQGSGLALWDGSGPHDLVLTWHDISACPGT
jgi:hypothetical protein